MNLPIGFTGTQKGITSFQEAQLRSELEEAMRVANMARVGLTLHHGDCVGADLQAHQLAFKMGLSIVIHPPVDITKRAFSNAGVFDGDDTIVLPAKRYIERNHDIVDAAKVLVACPYGMEMLRSGTWATVRYARQTQTATVIIYPDGRVEREDY